MNKKIPSLQKQLYLFYTEDGFMDLTLGTILLFFSLSLLSNLSWLVGITGFLPVLGWYLAKQNITLNRTGRIIPGIPMKKRFSNFFLAMIVLGSLILGIMIFSAFSGTFSLVHYPLSMFGLVLAMGISSLAILLHTYRFFFYAVLVFMAMSLGEITNASIPSVDTFLLANILSAVIILCVGINITFRFLKTYPKIEIKGNR